MPACGYEFYLLVFSSISHEWAQLTREISSWSLEDKIRIHARACNILFITHDSWANETLELYYAIIQFLIITVFPLFWCLNWWKEIMQIYS